MQDEVEIASLYREINENIETVNEGFNEVIDSSSTWLCECADVNCSEAMELTLGEYEQLRAHPNHFAVLPGHVYAEVEDIVEEHAHYVVVAKRGAAKSFAISHDPRGAERSP